MISEHLTDMSDVALVVAIGRWHQDALAEAYRRHGGAVFGLARRLLGDELAKDIAQEVFLRLWNQPERFDAERGSLRSYLLAHAHGRAVDVLRSETARRRREEQEARSAVEGGGYDLEGEVGDFAVAGQIREAVAGLPENERRAITLAYLGGHTYREVAGLLGEPEGTVKSRIRSGLRRLRAPLTQAGLVEV
jgi:RNA polymerase sigma-70 factor (ECF subfamily)